MRDELYHYGRKGMKWGQHIYGDVKVVTRSSAKEQNDIYNTLSKSDKKKLQGIDKYSRKDPPKTFTSDEQLKSNDHLKTFMTKYKNVPVSAFGVWNEGGGDVALSLMTRSGKKYRKKGYADKAVKQGMKWVDNNPRITTAYWDVRKDNAGSIALAKKYGFKEMKGELPSPQWTAYKKTYKRNTNVEPYK